MKNLNRIRRNNSAEAAAQQGLSPRRTQRVFRRIYVSLPADVRRSVEATAARFGGNPGEFMECAVFPKLARSKYKIRKSHLTEGAQRMLARIGLEARRLEARLSARRSDASERRNQEA